MKLRCPAVVLVLMRFLVVSLAPVVKDHGENRLWTSRVRGLVDAPPLWVQVHLVLANVVLASLR